MADEERNRLHQILNSHQNIIYDVFQLLDRAPARSTARTDWRSVIEIGESISRQATIVGMIWTGEPPLAEEIEENMGAYVNVLHGFILVSSRATAGAGPTLLHCVRSCVKKILDTSFQIMKESIDSHGICFENGHTIPKLAGAVWEACGDLEKIPNSNIIAIGQALTKVAVPIRDVLREMCELKPGPTDSTNVGGSSQTPMEVDDDLGNDLSPGEMSVAQAAITFVSNIVELIKELIRRVTAFFTAGNRENDGAFIDSLEKVLKGSQVIRDEIDELGACLYPPQELPAMKATLEKIAKAVDGMEKEMGILNGATESFVRVCGNLNGSMTLFKSELDRADTVELEEPMQKVELKN